MSSEGEFEVVEIPTRKVEIKITLDEMLDALGEQATLVARGAQQNQHLTRLSQLSDQLKGEVSHLDDALRDRLQRGRSA